MSHTLERPPKIHILNPKKWSFGCWDGFPFQSSDFQFPMFLFWLDHSNIFWAHLVKGEIFQCIPKLWWFISKDSLKEERSFFRTSFEMEDFRVNLMHSNIYVLAARVADLPPWIFGNPFFLLLNFHPGDDGHCGERSVDVQLYRRLVSMKKIFGAYVGSTPPPTQEASGKWVFPKIVVPQNGWFIMENSIKMDDLGVPLFSETSK